MTRLHHVDAAVRLALTGQEHLVLQSPLPLVTFPRVSVMSSRREPIRRDRSRDREDRSSGRDRYPPRGAPRRSRSRSPPRRGERNWRGSGMHFCNFCNDLRSCSTARFQTGGILQAVIERTIVATETGGTTAGTIDETTGGAMTGTGETMAAMQDGNHFHLPGLTETEYGTGTGTLGLQTAPRCKTPNPRPASSLRDRSLRQVGYFLSRH